MVSLLTTIFYQPIFNLLVFFYNIVPGNDIGIAIILMTVVIKLLLLPLSKKSIKSQKSLQELQPKMDKIKKDYANNKEEMGRKMMELYAEHKINPFSSCLPLLIQLPFLIAVFHVFRAGLSNGSLDLLYPFISKPEVLSSVTMGELDLAKPVIIFAVLAGISQFFQAKMMNRKKASVKSPGAKDENMASAMNKQMMYFMPIFTVFIGMSLPGGLTLYWLVTTILTILQQKFIFSSEENSGKDQEAIQNKKVVEGEIVNKEKDQKEQIKESK